LTRSGLRRPSDNFRNRPALRSLAERRHWVSLEASPLAFGAHLTLENGSPPYSTPHQCRERVCALAEIDRARRDHHERAGGGSDHRVALRASITAAMTCASPPRAILTATPSISSATALGSGRRRRRELRTMGTGTGSITAGTNAGACAGLRQRQAPVSQLHARRPTETRRYASLAQGGGGTALAVKSPVGRQKVANS